MLGSLNEGLEKKHQYSELQGLQILHYYMVSYEDLWKTPV